MARNLVEIVVKARDQASRAMQNVSRQSETMTKALRAASIAGVAVAGAIGASVREYARAGDEIQKMAQRTRFSTERLSELRQATRFAGLEFRELNPAIRRLQRVIAQGDDASKQWRNSLNDLGISFEELRALAPEDQFMRILEGLAGVEDQTKRTDIAFNLFSESGPRLLSLVGDSVEDLRANMEEARKTGVIFTEEMADEAAELNDKITELRGSLEKLNAAFADLAASPIIDVIEGITGALNTARGVSNDIADNLERIDDVARRLFNQPEGVHPLFREFPEGKKRIDAVQSFIKEVNSAIDKRIKKEEVAVEQAVDLETAAQREKVRITTELQERLDNINDKMEADREARLQREQRDEERAAAKTLRRLREEDRARQRLVDNWNRSFPDIIFGMNRAAEAGTGFRAELEQAADAVSDIDRELQKTIETMKRIQGISSPAATAFAVSTLPTPPVIPGVPRPPGPGVTRRAERARQEIASATGGPGIGPVTNIRVNVGGRDVAAVVDSEQGRQVVD